MRIPLATCVSYVETKLTDSELAGLKEAAEAVRAKQADVLTL